MSDCDSVWSRIELVFGSYDSWRALGCRAAVQLSLVVAMVSLASTGARAQAVSEPGKASNDQAAQGAGASTDPHGSLPAGELTASRTSPEAAGLTQQSSAVAAPSVASTTPEAPPEPPASAARRALSIASALVLGPVVHGMGHFTAGQPSAGLRLLAAEGIGLAAAAAGLGGLALTGASEKTVVVLAGVGAFGAGLFATSFLADVYGVVAPRGGFGSAELRPALVVDAGAVSVIDPLFDYDVLARVDTRAFFGRHSLLFEGDFGMDHDNQRLRGMYAYRFVEADVATYVEAELGAVHHRFAPEQFSMTFAEVAISGRLELGHISPTMAGAFVDGRFGLAFGGHRYFDVATESDGMLLMRMGFGFFIGDGGSWSLYYDHRHDGYTAGMKLPGLFSGTLGHVGTALQYYFSSQWGAGVHAETGSAHVIGLAVSYRRKQW